ncbi:TetR/AcrR family transcriptional regulator [Nocardia yamanashiensis]|uniref:TetR/AcrR family transcriptional regulator n=1 Tax=Nocardia yamanashiensis TaxID=209247 RepID=UPI000836608B|nr:TetR/AcrR family transcriptional regulator [Nocardia yamanashiensis]
MPPMTRSSQPRRQERRIALEGRLLDAAETLMGEQNLTFAELSVDRLAGAAGISRASFYLYFEDKGQLLRRLAHQALTEISEAAKTWWQAAERNNPDDLRQAMKNVLATYRRRRLILSAVVEEAAYDAGIAEVFNGLIDDVRSTTRKIIERGQASGRIRPMPTDEIADALTWMVERVCYQMIRNSDPENDETLATALTQIIWNTLYLADPTK